MEGDEVSDVIHPVLEGNPDPAGALLSAGISTNLSEVGHTMYVYNVGNTFEPMCFKFLSQDPPTSSIENSGSPSFRSPSTTVVFAFDSSATSIFF